ncbi:MAG: biotin-dependent carboxyltransferase family protein [Pyrinomonadaceae bacterium]|nr:biotin-dependent carboxyltransferase family protein [Pyrinomonadaceae bacterium]
MSILIRKPGILSTVQDLGRICYRSLGINRNGVMDRSAARLINILLNNGENAAVIEMHFPAAEILFERECLFALGGADFASHLDGHRVGNWRIHRAGEGSILTFQNKVQGERTYLAIEAGFHVQDWLGSASTNLSATVGGCCGRKLARNDRIELFSVCESRGRLFNQQLSTSLIPRYSRLPTVRVVKGGEYEMLKSKSRSLLESSVFQISNNSNRMGYRLIGEPMVLTAPTEILSSAVNFGTIQLFPDGQLIVLMADHQTTGGYPRIANVIEYDLPLLAQIGASDKVAFHLIDIADAERIAAAFQHDLELLKTGVRLCSNHYLG